MKKEQKKLCPICKWMSWPGPKYNVQDMSYHMKEHDKETLIYLITEDLKMKQ